jgi:carbamoyltransferase
VHEETNPRYYTLLKAFEDKTGYATCVNTSFNVRGEPIVCTPEDAYRCFMRTEMDVLVIENYVLRKEDQKPLAGDSDWKKEFELD